MTNTLYKRILALICPPYKVAWIRTAETEEEVFVFTKLALYVLSGYRSNKPWLNWEDFREDSSDDKPY